MSRDESTSPPSSFADGGLLGSHASSPMGLVGSWDSPSAPSPLAQSRHQEQLSRLMQLGEQRQKALLEEQVCAHASRRKLPRRTYLPVHACVRA